MKKVVLITGASTGLGLAITKLLIENGDYHIVATARASSLHRFNEQGISESDSLWIRPLDVVNKRQRDELIEEIEAEFGAVDVLVNNAGYSLAGVIEHVGETERLQQMDINFRAPLSLIRRVLPEMRRRQSGQIINISSAAGVMAMPTMGIYSASKFALEAATEALWYEVKPWNIKVTLVQPGFINSDGFIKTVQSSGRRKAMLYPELDYYYQYSEMSKFIAKAMALTPSSPNSVAKTVIKVIQSRRPPLRVAGTWDALALSLMRRLLPRSIYHFVLWKLLPKEMRKRTPQRSSRTRLNNNRPKSIGVERQKLSTLNQDTKTARN